MLDWSYSILYAIGLFAVLTPLRRFSANLLLRKKLRLSLMLAVFTAGLWLLSTFYPFPPQDALRARLETLEWVLIGWSLINAAVALLFNPFFLETSADKYPAIVQDAVVVGALVLVATYFFPDKLFTTSAIGALILGLALQDTLGNLFAGLAIQIEKPFRVGDWVQAAQHQGRVVEVTWRATKVRTKAGTFVVVPNNLVSKDMIVNYSHPSPLQRLEYQIGLGYEAPPNQVKQVILEVIRDVSGILREPAPDVLLTAYSDFSIDYKCRFWVNDFGSTELVLDRFATLLYYRLKRAGFAVPFPIQDLRITQQRRQLIQRDREPDDRLCFLERAELFRGLSEEDKKRIAAVLEAVVYAANEPIIRQGEAGDSMFFVRKGSVRVLLQSNGATQEVAKLSDGEYFGEMALLTGEPRTATVVAVGDVEAFLLSKEAFRSVLLEDGSILSEISRVIAQRKAMLEQQAAKVVVEDASVRTQETILGRIQKFFGL